MVYPTKSQYMNPNKTLKLLFHTKPFVCQTKNLPKLKTHSKIKDSQGKSPLFIFKQCNE